MRYYCTLFIRSDEGDAPANILVADVLGALKFNDNESPLNLTSAQRLRTAGFVRPNNIPRYQWHLDTREAVASDELDPFVHVSWLLSHLKPDLSLAQANAKGIETWLGFYWGGNGTGGGPFISVQLSELLARHQIGLNMGFYYEECESGVCAA